MILIKDSKADRLQGALRWGFVARGDQLSSESSKNKQRFTAKEQGGVCGQKIIKRKNIKTRGLLLDRLLWSL